MVWTSQLFLNASMDILYGVSLISDIFMYNIFMPQNFGARFIISNMKKTTVL